MNNTDFNIEAFLKIGDEKYMSKLLEDGEVYMNTVKYFREHEQNGNRGDKYEGTSLIEKDAKLEISIGNDRIASSNNSEIKLRYGKDNGNIFCLTSVFEQDLERNVKVNLNLSDELLDFGNRAILIYNPKKFINRVVNELKNLKVKYKILHVKYLDINDYSGTYSIFRKPAKYSFQKETRIFLQNDDEKTIILKIGNLKDIALMIEANKIKNLEFELR